MKARIPLKLSAKENAALDREIRRQAVASVSSYYLDLDVQDAYVLRTVFGFGAKRIEKFFTERSQLRADLQDRYGGEKYDNMAEIAMKRQLMDAGIDVKAMFEKIQRTGLKFALRDKEFVEMSKRKFKVGDKVKVIGNACYHGYKHGQILTLKEKTRKYAGKLNREVDAWCVKEGGYYATEHDIEYLTKNDKRIVITSDGVETLARLYEGNKVIKTAVAKCSSDDEFDFETGASIAFDRLTGEEKPKYKPGDKVKVVANTYTNCCEIGEILTLKERLKKDVLAQTLPTAWIAWDQIGYIRECDFEPYKEPEYFTGKVVCVKAGENTIWTAGKVYEFVDGQTDFEGFKFPPTKMYRTLDELNEDLLVFAKFIPFVE